MAIPANSKIEKIVSYIDDFLRQLQQELLPRARELLDSYESGRMSAGRRRLDGAWRDVTQDEIMALNNQVRIYLEFIEAHRGRTRH